ncbi:MAG: protein kinase, partial [Anaerolineae bacterium]|nr:protein kinase [Anaerolineae bacterium]
DDTFIARFKNEARSIANLQHPNIVTVHDVGSEGPTHYIVMEFVEGQDLKRVIRAYGALSVNRALDLAIQICAGLGYAHRAGIVHADVKPQNILLAEGDIVKITDFGIAQALSDTQPAQRQSVVWGSPHYFAPEQAQGEKPTAASDVYSIGIVMFEMLTGRLPYIGANQQELALAHIRERIPSVTEFNPAVPESLAKIIQKVMSKEPSARYRMADQLGHVLESYRARGREQTISNPSIPSSMPLPPQQTMPPAQSRPQTSPPPPTNLPFSQVQPPYQPTTPRPSFPPAEPTQRYSAVPEAPSSPQSARPSQLPSPFEAPAQTPPPRQAAVPQDWETTGRQYYSQALDRHEDISPGLDIITIMLAGLAFLAVACLIPLYIAVLQARLG